MVELSRKFSDSGLDPAKAGAILSSPEGQRLARLLQADGGKGLQAAAEALKQGDLTGLQAALSPLLRGKEAETLTQGLEGKL